MGLQFMLCKDCDSAGRQRRQVKHKVGFKEQGGKSMEVLGRTQKLFGKCKIKDRAPCQVRPTSILVILQGELPQSLSAALIKEFMHWRPFPFLKGQL